MPGYGNLTTVAGGIWWTYYSFNYTAPRSSLTLSFAVHGGPASEATYLDNVSVVDTSAPSVQLLRNPSFENSTLAPTGWSSWCSSSCTKTGDGHSITNSGCQPLSGIYCIISQCKDGYNYLGQSFSAIIGRTYSISFWVFKGGGPAGKFYANIL